VGVGSAARPSRDEPLLVNASLSASPRTCALCCNGSNHLPSPFMGPVIYLALVGAGLVAAAAISFVLRGIKLI